MQVNKVTFNQSVTKAELSCQSRCSSYTWIKNGQKVPGEDSSYTAYLNPGDSISCALKGQEIYHTPSLYTPDVPSVLVRPSGDIMEGSSVNLTCSNNANIVANYTWYKKIPNQKEKLLSEGPQLVFSSIQSSESGQYYCTAENELGRRTSANSFINVKYGPKRPSVSVSPSAEIVEGSSVTLTCSSDANPAANYTWYKENEDSPKASGQIFTITDVRPEHSGNYSCEAQNRRGRHNSTLHLSVRSVFGSHFPGEWISITAGTVSAILIVVILIAVLLWIRKKRARKQPPEPTDKPDRSAQNQPAEPKDNLHYASVNFSKKQADPLYANTITAPAQKPEREEEVDGVEYSTVKLNSGSTATRNSSQETGVDPAALYSTVYNPPQKHGYQNS